MQTLTLRWRAVRGSTGYKVVVRLDSGLMIARTLPARTREMIIPAYSRYDHGSATVTAIGQPYQRSRTATSALRAQLNRAPRLVL
jgi:hypothetical protein